MFTGIIEVTAEVSKFEWIHQDLLRLWVHRPKEFDDLKVGDSLSVNGVCLTVEALSSESTPWIQFAIGPETLRILSPVEKVFLRGPLNLERSLRFGDRIHGHLVSGHVEAQGLVTSIERSADTLEIEIAVPKDLLGIQKKGSLAVHGVSLTINAVDLGKNQFKDQLIVKLCIIPETLKRTNLGLLKIHDFVCVETDWMVKNLLSSFLSHRRDVLSDIQNSN